MKKLVFILVLALSTNLATASIASNALPSSFQSDLEDLVLLEEILNSEDQLYALDNVNYTVEAIEVIELEEEVALGFDPVDYLPEGFNALEGKNDLDWSKIEIIEEEEDVDLGFNPEDYLPEGFNALEGKNDLNWDNIEIVELEEEVEFDFDPQDYLPVDFNPYEGMACANSKDVSIH